MFVPGAYMVANAHAYSESMTGFHENAVYASADDAGAVDDSAAVICRLNVRFCDPPPPAPAVKSTYENPVNPAENGFVYVDGELNVAI